MRKTLFVLAMILLLVLTACGKKEPLPEGTDSSTGILILTPSEDDNISEPTDSFTETESNDETKDTSGSAVTDPKDTEATSSESSKQDTYIPPTDSSGQEDKQQQNTSSETESSTTSTENTTSTSTETTVTEPEDTETSATKVPTKPNATASDTKDIADLVVRYINEYRTEQGVSAAVYLPGLTEYAEYRSRQIISDFSHNTRDERAAATALRYGEYIDPSLYGMSGEPYYTACAGEAIAKAGYIGTPDYVASSLAALIRNSAGHWCYIGAAEYQYIGVGITYESGMWYCDVAMTRENQG